MATALGSEASRADDLNAVRSMAEICAAGPTSLDETRTALVESGWTNADVKVALAALTSGFFAFQFNPSDVGYSMFNAIFLAGSALGNSALGPNQLGLTAGDVSLGVYGIEEGKPYCVVTGPTWVFDSLTDGDTDIAGKASPGFLRIREGSIGQGSYVAALMDLSAVAALDPTKGAAADAGFPVTRADFDLFLASLGEATVHINSQAALQELTP